MYSNRGTYYIYTSSDYITANSSGLLFQCEQRVRDSVYVTLFKCIHNLYISGWSFHVNIRLIGCVHLAWSVSRLASLQLPPGS